jgi:hypothetical protein
MIPRITSVVLLLVLAMQSASAQVLHGPTPYLSTADSPFPLGSPGFALEDFEDGLLNAPGVTGVNGIVTSTQYPGAIIDSVDADDGVIDGTCLNGDSYFGGGGAVLRFQFDALMLGGLPKKVGIVWTDGGPNATVTFEAFDANGVSLGTIIGVAQGDSSYYNTTGEDRFYGIEHSGGIGEIAIGHTTGGIEVDHLQYLLPCASTISISYCTAKVNALGCTPSISSVGTPSATANSGFIIRSINMRNNKAGILFYTNGGRAAVPFSGGTLCLAGSIKRVQGLNSGGTPPPANDCSGVFSVDMNAFRAGLLGGNPAPYLSIPGTVVDAQFWGRDPGFSAPNNTQLSNGLEFTICQ